MTDHADYVAELDKRREMIQRQSAEIDCLTAEVEKLRAALLMGVQLCHSGGHGNGKECPTCHFMREAQKAIGLEVGWHPTIKADEQ